MVSRISERTRTITWDDPLLTAAAAQGRSGLEFLQALARGEAPPAPIMQTVGAHLQSVEPGKVVFAFSPQEYHYNPIGSVHGGIYATLLDSACGCAVHSMLPAGTGYTSLDLNVKFLGAMRTGTGEVACTGTVTHLGKRTALAAAELRDGTGRLLGSATSTCLLLAG